MSVFMMQSTTLFSQFNYIAVIILMMVGLYVVFASRNLIKKLVGLSVFQTSVFLLYITISKVSGGQPPILVEDHVSSDEALAAAATQAASIEAAHGGAHHVVYSNPLPHVLILTAIVVGVATLAIGLSLVVRIREAYGCIEEDRIEGFDFDYTLEGISK